VLLRWLKAPCQHERQDKECSDHHHDSNSRRYGQDQRSKNQRGRIGEEEADLPVPRALFLLAQRVLVKGAPHSDGGSPEEIRAVADEESADHAHEARSVPLDKHPSPERDEADAAGTQERTDNCEQNDHREGIDRPGDDLDGGTASGVIPEHWPKRALPHPTSYLASCIRSYKEVEL
jgi:hypothetical protein